MKGLTEMSHVEQVCWLAARDGGGVDMRRKRSANAERKITAARLEDAITDDGLLTAKGWRIARECGDA